MKNIELVLNCYILALTLSCSNRQGPVVNFHKGLIFFACLDVVIKKTIKKVLVTVRYEMQRVPLKDLTL